MLQKLPRGASIQLILLIVIVISVVISIISAETERGVTEEVRQKLISVASIIGSQIDGDALAAIQPGDENSTGFLKIRDQLHRIKQYSEGIRYIYTMRKSGDAVEYIVDGDYGYDPEPGLPVIGQQYPQAEPELYQGFSTPTADHAFTTDEWGTALSGFSPVRNRAGEIVGIVGIDMDSTVVTGEISYIRNILYFVGVIAILASTLGILMIERRRDLDEQKIRGSEEKYRYLFERAGDAIFLLEATGPRKGAILAANNAASIMHGYSPEELCLMNIDDLHAGQDRKQAAEQIFQEMNGEWAFREHIHRRKDGTVFPVEGSAGIIDLGSGKVILVMNHDITERKRASIALEQASKKLNLLNTVTFSDIKNSVYALAGYLELEKSGSTDQTACEFIDQEEELIRNITRSLDFARYYQDLGTSPPRWQHVNQAFVMGISHLDFSSVRRSVHLDNLEIFVDSLLEQVFFSLASNVLYHGKKATSLVIEYQETADGLRIIFEDDGVGIPAALKEKVFERGFGTKKGMGLFLVREILGITGITITETGTEETGARFEIQIPLGAYRFSKEKVPGSET